MVSQEALFTPIHGHIGKFKAIGHAIEIVKSEKTLAVILPNLSTVKHCTVWYYGNYCIRDMTKSRNGLGNGLANGMTQLR